MNSRFFTMIVGVIGLAACGTKQGNPDANDRFFCTEPRPQICTMDYRPVCAQLANSAQQATYANGCGACADPNVESHRPGSCQP